MSNGTDDMGNQLPLPGKKKGVMGLTIHMTAGRWLMVGVGGVGMLTAFGALWLMDRGTQVDAGANVNMRASSGIHNTPGKSSPEYAAQVAAYNKKHAEEALRHDQSFVGIPVTGTTLSAPQIQPVDDQQTQQVPQPPQINPDEQQQPQRPQTPAADGAIAKEFGAIASAMKNQRIINPGYYIPEYQMPEQSPSLESVSGSVSPSGNGSASTGSTTDKPAIRPGTIIYGVFENAMKSTMPGPVIGELVQGKYNGDRVIGSFTRAHGSNALLIRMKTLVLPSGKTVSIDGYAVSPRTTLPGMATNVNYHILTRMASFLGSAFLAGVEGYGAAIAQEGSTTTNSLYGGTTTSYPQLTPAQTLDIAVGQAAQQLEPLQQGLQNNITEPNTVSVAQGTPFGLLVVSSGSGSSGSGQKEVKSGTNGNTTSNTAMPQGSGSALQPVGVQPSYAGSQPYAGGQPYAGVRQPYTPYGPELPVLR
jgi:type IV secretory pathway VirB10-like protein